MTYGLGIHLRGGVVLAADTRTNAGVDHIATMRKLNVFHLEGQTVLALAAAGNLATTQAVVSLLNQRLGLINHPNNLFGAATMFDAARMVGNVLREVMETDGGFVRSYGDPSATLLLGGQVAGGGHGLFLIYSAGNFIEAGPDTPFLQIGELKYGKPILDRVIDFDTRLPEAAKIGLLSFDATVRSNLSVAPPIDIFTYQANSFSANALRRIVPEDAYFSELRSRYSDGLKSVVAGLPPVELDQLGVAVRQ